MAPILRVNAFKYSDDVTHEQKLEILSKYKELFKNHAELSAPPRNGRNRSSPQFDRGFDIVVHLEFPNRKAAERYDVHPAHIEFKEFVGARIAETFMYEFDLEQPASFQLESKLT